MKNLYIAFVCLFTLILLNNFNAQAVKLELKENENKKITDEELTSFKKLLAQIMLIREQYKEKYKKIFQYSKSQGLPVLKLIMFIKKIRKNDVNIGATKKEINILNAVLGKIKYLSEEYNKFVSAHIENNLGVDIYNLISKKLKSDSALRKRFSSIRLMG